jgi:hypothetical protein
MTAVKAKKIGEGYTTSRVYICHFKRWGLISVYSLFVANVQYTIIHNQFTPTPIYPPLPSSEDKFLDVIGTKVLRFFLLPIHRDWFVM